MSIQWGDWQYASGNGMRVGLDVSVPLAPTHSSPSVTFQINVYTQNQYNYSSDAQSLDYSNDLAGSVAFTNNNGSSQILRDTQFYTFPYTTFGSSPGNLTFTATISGSVNGITPSKTQIVAIPARPVSGPAVPTAVVATRNSDTQATLTWTPHPTGPEPITGQTISMRRWNGAVTWTEDSWDIIANVSGSTTSYVKNGLSSNHPYQLSVRAENSSGSSDWVDSNVIFMSEAPPSNVVSVMNSTATAITTTWKDNSYVYPATGTWKIQRSVAGGAFADVGTVGTKTPTSFTDPSPGVGTNQYRVSAVVGAVLSSFVAGNIVAAATAPNAPTLLQPDGSFVDFLNNNVVFSWQHNPGGTNSAQTHFTIEKSIDNGVNWTALGTATNVASAVSSFTLPAGTLPNGLPVTLWRVRTQGTTTAGFSPNSASAAVLGFDKPVITLTLPLATTNTAHVVARWTFAQAQGVPQSIYIAQLYAADGVTLLQEIDGFDITTTVPFTYPTVTGTTYVVKVQAAAGGIFSDIVSATTNFVLIPPVLPAVTGAFQVCSATVLLHLTPGTVVPGTNVAAESVMIERRVQGGDWVTLASGVLIPTDFVDTLPLTNGTNEYRVTAVSATPSFAATLPLAVPGTDGDADGDPLWAWLSYGDSFEFDLRVHGDLSISEVTGRLKSVQHFLGRARPVALVGQNTSRALTLSGALMFDRRCPTAIPDDCAFDTAPVFWRDSGENSEVVCYRDFTGRRIFGVLSDVSTSDGIWPGMGSVGLTLTEVDFTERYVQLVSA